MLEREEKNIVQMLDNEEETILNSFVSVEDEVAQHSQIVKDLISELEHRLQGSTVGMLQVRLKKKPQHLRFEKK